MRLGLFLIDSKSIFQGQQKADAVAAARACGVPLEIQFAEGDSRVQREQVFTFLREEPRPEAIVVEPVEDAGLRFVGREALEKGVAFVLINRTPTYLADLRRDPGGVVFSVSADARGIGTIQGEQFRALLPQGGTVLYVTGPSQTDQASQRLAGVEASKGEGISLIRLVGAWTEKSGEDALSDWLGTTRGFVGFDLVGAQNDDMAIGARNALQRMAASFDRPEWTSIRATGVDGMPEYGQRLVADGDLAATVVMPPTTGKAINLLMRILEGRSDYDPAVVVPVRSHPDLETLRSRG